MNLENDVFIQLRDNLSCMSFEEQYYHSLMTVKTCGVKTGDRTGTGRQRLQGMQFIIGLENGELPVLLGKNTYPKMAIKEMTWMLMGDTNTKFLEDNGVTYWREWQDENGNLGPVYGKQFRNFGGVDQLVDCIHELLTKKYSTQNLISLWNPIDRPKMALPPCHFSYHFVVCPDERGIDRLNLHMQQRSADSFLGVPYNAIMASYFTILMATLVGFEPGKVYWTLNDYHIYDNHHEQVEQYLRNVNENKFGTIGKGTPLAINYYSDDGKMFELPTLNYGDGNTDEELKTYIRHDLEHYFISCAVTKFQNIVVNKPQSYPDIKADIAV